MNAPVNRRFYTAAHVVPVEGGWGVRLDHRVLTTPERRELILPTEALAQVLAAEWARQGETLNLGGMHANRLANVVLDRVHATREQIVVDCVRHAATDLLAFPASEPVALVQAQTAAWQPVRAWAEARHRIRLSVQDGLLGVGQGAATLEAIGEALLELDDWRLGLAASIGPLCASMVLALAVVDGHLPADEAYAVSRLEEEHQARHWGRDAEADARAADIAAEVALYGVMLRALPVREA
jgi:chaperone required for assembly of F1-ATPase